MNKKTFFDIFLMKLKHQKYLICFGFAVILLVFSLNGPGFLFAIQDQIQMRKTWQGITNSLDIEVLNASYSNKRERFTAFAQGISLGKKYYASGVEVSLTKEEQYALLEQTIPFYYYSDGCTVIDWKKYIIFDNAQVDSNTSVAFMTWYIELLGKDEKTVKILVDTEDLTVYYVKVTDSSFEDIMSSQMYNDDYLLTYYEPDLMEYEADKPITNSFQSTRKDKAENTSKVITSAENYYINMYYDSQPLQWELIYHPYLQAGFTDMKVLIPELQE